MKAKLALRDFAEDDLVWFLEVRNSVREFLHNPSQFSLLEAKAWFPANAKNYRIILNFGEPIGYFRIGKISHHDTKLPLLEIGADLAITHQGKGLAFLAYKKFLPKFKREFRVRGFTLQVVPKNVRALNLYLKIGFRLSTLYMTSDDEMKISNLELIYIPTYLTKIFKTSRSQRIRIDFS